MYSPLVHGFMQQKQAMYAKVDDAPVLAQKLRALFSFPIGVYHFAVFADSGIQSLQDIRGKKVFLGPPSGAATAIARDLIAALTGGAERGPVFFRGTTTPLRAPSATDSCRSRRAS